MNETSTKQPNGKTDDDPAATHASTRRETGTTTQPKHPNIANDTTNRDYSSRSQRRPN
jgi:hypothetical protein